MLTLLLATTLFIGCAKRGPSRPATPQAQPLHRAAGELERRVVAVMEAPTPAAEGDALKKLHDYKADHGLTYDVKTFRTYDNQRIEAASIGNQPVRADVTIYNGREIVRTFSFVPHDNRNLALLGE